jgi:hypothetical protein
LRNIKEYQRRFNFDKIPQQRAGCSNLDQRITNGGDEVAEVAEIFSYDQTREVAEILSYDHCNFLNSRCNARVRFP